MKFCFLGSLSALALVTSCARPLPLGEDGELDYPPPPGSTDDQTGDDGMSSDPDQPYYPGDGQCFSMGTYTWCDGGGSGGGPGNEPPGGSGGIGGMDPGYDPDQPFPFPGLDVDRDVLFMCLVQCQPEIEALLEKCMANGQSNSACGLFAALQARTCIEGCVERYQGCASKCESLGDNQLRECLSRGGPAYICEDRAQAVIDSCLQQNCQ